MLRNAALISTVLAAVANAQLAGTLTAETHPSLPAQKCTASGCTTQNTAITLDSNWRWLHTASGSENCYTGNAFNATNCPDNKTCAQKCALDGADYSGTYGITTSGNALTLKFVTKGTYGTNVGSRVYLMASDTKYQMFKLLNQEFTFDVDVSKLPCGFNGALYLSEMLEDGGMSKEPLNKAGAKYGTGYCDAQCPHDIKFIGGEANAEGWTASPNDVNAGSGKYGTCCPEMDIWEANSISTAYTPHPCRDAGPFRCSGADCGDGADRYSGACDKDGCDFNSYRMGNKTFYGKGKTIDTSKVVTVVTQFITTTGTASGTLKEIRRKYVQGGKVIENSVNRIAGIPETNSLTDDFCKAQKTVFNDKNHFATRGGMTGMSGSMNRGMVLSLSIWADFAARMLWLDSTYPTDSTAVGAARGECSTDSGFPDDLQKNSPDASVTFSNIRWGDLDTTYKGTTTNPPPVSSTTTRGGSSSTATPSPSPSTQPGSVPKWGQCGGIGYTGPTTCAGSTCTKVNDWYSQCL